MFTQIYRALWILHLAVALAGCNGSATDNISNAKLTSEEQGVLEAIRPPLGYLVTQSVAATKNANLAANARLNGKLAEAEVFEGKRRAALVSVGTAIVKWSRRSNTGPKLIFPDSLMDLRSALRELLELRHRLQTSYQQGQFSPQDLWYIEQGLLKVRNADNLVALQLNSRKANFDGSNIKTSVIAELAGIPLALDITTGEVKVKWTKGIGPVKWTLATGPGSSEGIKTLILRSGDSQRIFAVAGREIFLHIPEATLQTSGSRMVITAL